MSIGGIIGLVVGIIIAGLSTALGVQSSRAKKFKQKAQEELDKVLYYEEVNDKASSLKDKDIAIQEKYKEEKIKVEDSPAVSGDIASASADFIAKLRNKENADPPAN